MNTNFTQRFFLAFTIFLLPTLAIAQSASLSVSVKEAGTLEQVLEENIATVETLIITGNLNDIDVKTMIDMAENHSLKHIDMAKVSIEDEYLEFPEIQIISIILPDNLVNLPPYAFISSWMLERVTLPKGLKTIGEGAFNYNGELQMIDLPAGIEEIGDRAFDGCYTLTSVILPGSLGEIANYAIFTQCTGLETVVLEEGITHTGANLFAGCMSITTVSLPSSLKSIDGQAFYGTTSLETITIPEKVEYIGPYAFMSANNLNKVCSKNPTPPVLEMAFFYETKSEGMLYVPAGSVELYKAEMEWDEFNYVQEEISTNIENEIVKKQNMVHGGTGEIVLKVDDTTIIEVYTLTGARLETRWLNAGEHHIALHAGAYIAKIGNRVYKVLVN